MYHVLRFVLYTSKYNNASSLPLFEQQHILGGPETTVIFLGAAHLLAPWCTLLEISWVGALHTHLLPRPRNMSCKTGAYVLIGFAMVRGRATERQDHHLPLVHRIAEGSEELRLSLCRMVGRMLVTLMDRGTVGVLRPYLDDTILLLVSQCRDPYSTVTVEALSIITKLVVHPHLEQVRCCVQHGSISCQTLQL